MALGLLVGAAIIDVALAALLIGISGFIVGHGPESMQAGRLGAAVLMAAILGCLAAPAVGFFMRVRQRPAGGIMVAWLPPVVGLIALAIPPNY